MRKPAQIFALVAIAAALLGGLATIIGHRSGQTGTYPPFSTYRTLPEGASVLYEALGRTPGVTATRNIRGLGAVHFTGADLFLLGFTPATLSSDGQWFNDIEEIAGAGNRVILGLLPRRNRFLQADKNQGENALDRWSIRLAFFHPADMRDEEEDQLTPGWPMYFAGAPGWKTVYSENDKPVVVEKTMGKGSVVVMANPYLLSNAAMVEDRRTDFLSTVIGPVHQAVFDETHFGIEETGSIAGLARRYRLQGLILGLVIVASLFIWKSAAGFPPPYQSLAAPGTVAGEDSNAAFVNLIRRHIRHDDVLSTCVEEWRKMYQRKAGSNLPAAIDLAESGRKTPAGTYAKIQQILGAKRNLS